MNHTAELALSNAMTIRACASVAKHCGAHLTLMVARHSGAMTPENRIALNRLFAETDKGGTTPTIPQITVEPGCIDAETTGEMRCVVSIKGVGNFDSDCFIGVALPDIGALFPLPDVPRTNTASGRKRHLQAV